MAATEQVRVGTHEFIIYNNMPTYYYINTVI